MSRTDIKRALLKRLSNAQNYQNILDNMLVFKKFVQMKGNKHKKKQIIRSLNIDD